ncbi:MAG: hypothetical protein JO307_12765 [Bryobacterales bacterium]|nr:hypothetical protein [Bryobacterales bacterium]MBV9397747.1 hypothetical protein [Bryobacterales bacterium]
MGLSQLMGILNQYRDASPGAPPANVENDYSQVAQSAPQSHLATGLAEAFRSKETPPFGQMLSTLFSNSNGQQRAGILNQLLGSVGPGLLASGGLSHLAGLLRGGQPSVTPEQANQVSPEAVQQLAEHAEKQNPSIVDQAGQFYAQHPTLVKALGAGSLALIMSHLSRQN